MESSVFLCTFVYNHNCGIMEENNNNLNTGSKGVFPGNNVPTQGSIQTGPPIKDNPQPNLSHHEETTEEQVIQGPEKTPGDLLSNPVGNQEAKTYIRLETKNSEGQLSGILEIDLISFRERGQESRYLSLNAVGAGKDGNQSDTTINIDNEADFNRFKEFIAKLNWND